MYFRYKIRIFCKLITKKSTLALLCLVRKIYEHDQLILKYCPIDHSNVHNTIRRILAAQDYSKCWNVSQEHLWRECLALNNYTFPNLYHQVFRQAYTMDNLHKLAYFPRVCPCLSGRVYSITVPSLLSVIVTKICCPRKFRVVLLS